MKIYISGPITGIPNGNIDAFSEAEDLIIRLGHVAVNPWKINPPGNTYTYREKMARDLIELVRCDAILMLPGSYRGKGALVELHVARVLDLKVLELAELACRKPS